jgi:hypothetical protein
LVTDLSDNQIGSEGGAKLAAMLEANDTLLHLDLSWNAIRGKGAEAMMGCLANLLALTSLRMRSNGIGDAGSELAQSLAGSQTLTDLDLSNCRMGPASALAIARGVRKNTALCRLTLDRNPFCAAARELHGALVRRACKHQGLEWSLDNVAWDLRDRAGAVPESTSGAEGGAGGASGRAGQEGVSLSGRHLLDLRSPHDKEVFVRIARYALEHGADAWRNEIFLQNSTWKR